MLPITLYSIRYIAIQFHHNVGINSMYFHSQSRTHRTTMKSTENAINSQASNNWVNERTERENLIAVQKQKKKYNMQQKCYGKKRHDLKDSLDKMQAKPDTSVKKRNAT